MGNKASNNEHSLRNQLLNVAIMAGGTWLIWYLSGPLTAEIGRSGYEWLYDKLWGTPTLFSRRFFEWAFVYTPNRSHLENWLYNYAEYAGPIVAAPFLYKAPDMLRKCFRGSKDKSENSVDRDSSSDEEFAIDELERAMRNLDTDDEQSYEIVHRAVTTPYFPSRGCVSERGTHSSEVDLEHDQRSRLVRSA